MPTPDHPLDPALRHDVCAVLALPQPRAVPLLAPLAHDVLAGAYGDAPRARLAALLSGGSRLPWRRPDPAAARERLEETAPDHLETALRHLAGLPSR